MSFWHLLLEIVFGQLLVAHVEGFEHVHSISLLYLVLKVFWFFFFSSLIFSSFLFFCLCFATTKSLAHFGVYHHVYGGVCDLQKLLPSSLFPV